MASGECFIEFGYAYDWVNINCTGYAYQVTAAHLHCGTPGTNGDVVVDLAPTTPVSGVFVAKTFTNADVIPKTDEECPVLINNIASLAYAMYTGTIYVNVHSTQNPGGEIRGQVD